MSSGGNYTRISNTLLDDYALDLSGSAVKIVLAILRLTVGWGKPAVILSQNELSEKAKVSRSTVCRCVKEAQDHGVLEIKETAKGTAYRIKPDLLDDTTKQINQERESKKQPVSKCDSFNQSQNETATSNGLSQNNTNVVSKCDRLYKEKESKEKYTQESRVCTGEKPSPCVISPSENKPQNPSVHPLWAVLDEVCFGKGTRGNGESCRETLRELDRIGATEENVYAIHDFAKSLWGYQTLAPKHIRDAIPLWLKAEAEKETRDIRHAERRQQLKERREREAEEDKERDRLAAEWNRERREAEAQRQAQEAANAQKKKAVDQLHRLRRAGAPLDDLLCLGLEGPSPVPIPDEAFKPIYMQYLQQQNQQQTITPSQAGASAFCEGGTTH